MRYQPSLQTERLRLRPFIADDAEMLVKLAGTREIADTTICKELDRRPAPPVSDRFRHPFCHQSA